MHFLVLTLKMSLLSKGQCFIWTLICFHYTAVKDEAVGSVESSLCKKHVHCFLIASSTSIWRQDNALIVMVVWAPKPTPHPPSLRLTLEAPLQLMLSIHNKASIFKISTQMGRFRKLNMIYLQNVHFRFLFAGSQYMNTSQCTLCLTFTT